MRQFYLPVVLLLISIAAKPQFKAGVAYSLSIPQSQMAENIQPLHSMNGSFSCALPGAFKRIEVGAELSLGTYASITKEQSLRFPDGSGTTTDVNYSSNVFSGAVTGRVNLLEKGKVIPYLSARGGYSGFYSNIYVEDPEDPNDCKALEKKNIIRDHTLFAAYGGGIKLDLNLFAKKCRTGRNWIDISVNKINGGRLDYINTKNLQSHIHTDPANPMPPTKGQPLNIQFVNVNTQVIHEHQVAEVYNSPLRMLDIKVGMVFELGK